jgi:cell division protein FtsQ
VRIRRTPGGNEANPTQARTARRFARRQWARRFGAWKALLGIAALLGVIGGAVWLLYFSATLAARGATVTGVGYLTEEQVVTAAQIPVGQPLVRVDLGAVESRVRALPAVRSVTVTRAWPDQVSIDIVERTPVAVVEVSGAIRGMDLDGVLFREYPRIPSDLPLITTTSLADSSARKEAARVVSALPPALARRVDHVEVVTIDRITLVLRDDRTVVWGSADDSAQKARVLEVLLEHDAKEYDVSVPSQPTTSG